jgi:nucleotide-binding universal stress UspA family protein
MLKRLLAATDFTPSADAAWRFAVDLAAAQGTELILLHVTMPLAAGAAFRHRQDHERLVATAQRRLAERVAEAGARGVRAKAVIRTGDPSVVIAQTARDEALDLVVVGAHGCTDPNQIVVGSVAERVVRAAPCAVLIVKFEERAESRAA